MRNEIPKKGAGDLAWKLFQKTGNPGYYMLYHDLEI